MSRMLCNANCRIAAALCPAKKKVFCLFPPGSRRTRQLLMVFWRPSSCLLSQKVSAIFL